jgi:signal transduction histidine kinase/ligand-binding sensor domain-containing protein
MRKIHFTLFSVILFLNLIIAQKINYKIEQISASDGLTASSILSIIQDNEGYLWVGTVLGLNRYDGINFKNYFHDPTDKLSLSSNSISCLAIDKTGELWVGTDGGGVNRFNKFTGNFERFDIPKKTKNSKGNNSIWAVTPDSKGNIWVGSYGDGINKINSKTGEISHVIFSGIGDDKTLDLIQDILCDSDGNLWIATDGAGIIWYNPITNKAKNYKKDPDDPNSLSHNYISKIRKGEKGVLWVSTYGRGICKFDIKTEKFIRISKDLIGIHRKAENEIWGSLYEPDGTLWLGFWGRGLAKYNTLTGEVEFIGEPAPDKKGLSSKIVLPIYRDRSGVLWVGTSEGGLNKITQERIREHTLKSLLGNELQINSLYSLNDERFLVGTENGLFILNEKMEIDREILLGDESKKITSIAKFQNNYWVGSFGGGITLLNDNFVPIAGGKFTRGIEKNRSAISSSDVTKIFISSDSTLWIGTFGEGLNKFDPITKLFSYFRYSGQSLIPQDHDKITDIKESKDGEIVFSTFSHGIGIFDPKTNKFSEIKGADKTTQQLPFKIIYSIFVDENDLIWCATMGGLMKVSMLTGNSEVLRLNSLDKSSSVFTISQVDNKNLLIATSDKIYKYNMPNNSIVPIASIQSSNHKKFIAGAEVQARGLTCFGTDKGIISFRLDEFTQKKTVPQIAISEVLVNDIPVKFQEAYYKDEEFLLTGDEKRLQIVLSMFEYQPSSSFTLKYNLEGWDDPNRMTSIEPGVPILFSNLSPGSYKFRYFVEGIDGTKKEGKAFILVVEPPFYQSWWFLSSSLFLFLAIVFFAANTRIKGLKIQRDIQREYSNLLIDSQESERKRIAAELHDSIGQDLAVIKNLAVMQKQKEDEINENEHLTLLIEVCTEAIEDVRKIAYDLRPYQIGKIGLTKAIEHLIQKTKNATEVSFEPIRIENIDNLLREKGELHIYRILQECLSNTLKYAKAKTISLEIINNDNKINIEYKDDGIGFDMNKGKGLSEAGGLGLMDIRERSSILSADYYLTSEVGGGVKLLLIIPLQKEKNG